MPQDGTGGVQARLAADFGRFSVAYLVRMKMRDSCLLTGAGNGDGITSYPVAVARLPFRLLLAAVHLAGLHGRLASRSQFGVPLLPDGRRTRVLELAGVVAYDLPKYASSIKVKALHSVISENNVGSSWGVVAGWFRKFR